MEENTMLLSNHEFNLSDFALFLSVMKIPRAYQCALSIFMEEPDIELTEVKVEQVILNKVGKRAIRLDAWAKSKDNRQFNMEMQNNTENDDVRKRSRYYQSMLDTPILKSGKETRYKNLPSTVIIFITQDDIFGKDLAKYTFTERCKEVKNLELEDGTTKIFLNMTSKNGSQELVSLLQYMKETRIDNPNIILDKLFESKPYRISKNSLISVYFIFSFSKMFLIIATNSAFASDAPDFPLAPVYLFNPIPFPKNPALFFSYTLA